MGIQADPHVASIASHFALHRSFEAEGEGLYGDRIGTRIHNVDGNRFGYISWRPHIAKSDVQVCYEGRGPYCNVACDPGRKTGFWSRTDSMVVESSERDNSILMKSTRRRTICREDTLELEKDCTGTLISGYQWVHFDFHGLYVHCGNIESFDCTLLSKRHVYIPASDDPAPPFEYSCMCHLQNV